MSIVLFAIIGAIIKAGTGYWICYSIYCVVSFIRLLAKMWGDT